jgi:PST family polysaccharide transporter
MKRGILWSTIAFVAGRAVTFGTTLVLVRLLAPAAFGLVAAVVIYLSLIELASDLGMKASVVYEQQRGITDRVQTAFTLNIVLAALLSAIAFALAPQFADLFRVGNHADLFRLGALNPFITGLANIHDSLLLRELAFRRRTAAQVLRAAVRGAVGIGLALAGLGATALVIGFLAGSVTWVVVLWVLVPLRPKLVFDRAIARSMAAYGGAAAALEVLAVIGSRVDSFVVAHALDVTALGLYTIAFRVPELLLDNVSNNVSVVAFPALAHRRSCDATDLPAPTLGLLRYGALYALPASAAIAILSTPLVAVVFGPRWAPAAGALAAIAVGCGLHAIAYPLGDVFKAIGRQRTMVAINLVSIPVLAASLLLAAPYGLTALAWVRTAVGLSQAGVLVGLSALAIGIHWRGLLEALRPGVSAALGAAAGAAAVRLAWPALEIGPLLAGCAAAGCGALAGLRGLVPGELTALRNLLPRPRASVGLGGSG